MSIVLTNNLEKLLSPARKKDLVDIAPTLPNLAVNAVIRDAALISAQLERDGIIAWLRAQRNDVPATGEEFANALSTQWPGALFVLSSTTGSHRCVTDTKPRANKIYKSSA